MNINTVTTDHPKLARFLFVPSLEGMGPQVLRHDVCVSQPIQIIDMFTYVYHKPSSSKPSYFNQLS